MVIIQHVIADSKSRTHAHIVRVAFESTSRRSITCIWRIVWERKRLGLSLQVVINHLELILSLLAVPVVKHDAQDARMRAISPTVGRM